MRNGVEGAAPGREPWVDLGAGAYLQAVQLDQGPLPLGRAVGTHQHQLPSSPKAHRPVRQRELGGCQAGHRGPPCNNTSQRETPTLTPHHHLHSEVTSSLPGPPTRATLQWPPTQGPPPKAEDKWVVAPRTQQDHLQQRPTPQDSKPPEAAIC